MSVTTEKKKLQRNEMVNETITLTAADLCRLKSAAYNEGFNEAYQEGYDAGFSEGYEEGYDYGCQEIQNRMTIID
jgi:flagellar biosynthesis/type III secretory pathway protein FliH